MATRTPKQLISGVQVANTATTYYTVPTATTTTIAAMTVTNTTASAATLTLHLVPSAGSASAANMVVSARPIASGESYNVVEAIGQTIPTGATIQALSGTASALTLVSSGYEQV